MAVVRNIFTGNLEGWRYALIAGAESDSAHKCFLVDLDQYYREHTVLNVNQIINVRLAGPEESVNRKSEQDGVLH